MTSVKSMKRRRSMDSEDNSGKIDLFRRSDGPRGLHVLSLGDEIPESVKRAIREALRAKERSEIMLEDDRKAKQRAGKVLESQQSKLRKLQMFTTSDGSIWLDHFYDNIAEGILESEQVQTAIRQSLDETRITELEPPEAIEPLESSATPVVMPPEAVA